VGLSPPRGIKRKGDEAGRSPPAGAKIKNGRGISPLAGRTVA
jgi:hypothetical protein